MTATIPDLVTTVPVTIGAAASLSGASTKILGQLVAIIPDASWTTNAVTFQGSLDGATFFDLWTAGAEYSVLAIPASKWQAVSQAVFTGVKYIKVRSGTSGTPVTQGSSTVITLVTRPIQ